MLHQAGQGLNTYKHNHLMPPHLSSRRKDKRGGGGEREREKRDTVNASFKFSMQAKRKNVMQKCTITLLGKAVSAECSMQCQVKDTDMGGGGRWRHREGKD